MGEKQIKVKRKEFYIRIGPLLKEFLYKEKEIIKNVSYDCVTSSEWEAGEILAKKITVAKLI